MHPDVELLTRPEARAALSFWQLLRLYLDPFSLFRSATAGTGRAQAEALRYNRRHRRILLTYVRRWAVIALACVGAVLPLGALARSEPVLCVPILGLGLGFSLAVCALLLSLAVYVVLGIDDGEA